jgi:hypothetical protein
MKKRALLVLAIGFPLAGAPSTAIASPTDNTAPGFGSSTVSYLQPGHSAETWFWTNDPAGCSGFFKISRSHPSHDHMFKTLMAAKLSSRTVDLYYETISGTCWLKKVGLAGP